MTSVSGHVFRYEGKRRPVWRAKYRLPDGRQVQKTIGPAWTARGRPREGYFTKRTAEAWLRQVLAGAAAGTLPGLVRSDATVADACAEYLRYIEQDRQRKPSTLRDYASIFHNYVLPHLGDVALEDLTAERVERLAAVEIDPDRRLANRTREKTITVFHGCMERARRLHRLPFNPVADVEKPRTALRTEINVFSPEEVMALVRAADSEQDAAIYLTAAYTGLRQGELIALRWRDVDFAGSAIRVRASYTNGHLTTPKSGKVRSVPRVAEALARLSQREYFTDEDDLVFCGLVGGYLDGSALPSATERPSGARRYDRSAFTTSATHSERGSSASPTSAASRNGWATRTSRRRCSTSTTSRARRTPRSSARPSSHRPARRRPTSRTPGRAVSSSRHRGFVLRFMLEIHPSARKHGIADEDIEHAVTHAMAIDDTDDDARLYIGPARNAALLEVVTIPAVEGSELAIHAMGMRPKYRPLLSDQ